MLTILERNSPDPRQVVQLYRASLDMAQTYNHCGLLNDFYEHVTKISTSDQTCRYIYTSIDVRVHMLMPGWYPCIPGWHCDDFLRDVNGDPDLDRILGGDVDAQSLHVATTIDFGTGSLPQFIDKDYRNIEGRGMRHNGETYYGFLNRIIEDQALRTTTQVTTTTSGQVYTFGPLDIHRGVPAIGRGWRVFARATFSNHREPKDEVRTQSQVYLENVGAGW